MNELQDTKLKRPMDKLNMGGDVAALNALLGLMNNPDITGAVVPKGAAVKAGEVVHDNSGATLVTSDPLMASDVPESSHHRSVLAPLGSTVPTAQPTPVTPRNSSRIFYTGLSGAGKDYIAQQTGATILRMSEPLHYLAEYFFVSTVNDAPGVQQFLQAADHWGRGDVSEQFPLTPARACFVSMIRSLGEAGRFDGSLEVDWATYGRDKNIWLWAIHARVEKHGNARFAMTAIESTHDFKRLSELGWTHFHVMCSPETRSKRMVPGHKPTVADALASALNADVTKRISAQPRGAKLRVIWNDTVPSPSPRLYSVAEFLASLTPPENNAMIVTGE